LSEKNGVLHETNGKHHEESPMPAYKASEDTGEDETFLTLDRKLVRKIDWHLLPWICLLYALGLVDRFTRRRNSSDI
jgi:hypothetical protein